MRSFPERRTGTWPPASLPNRARLYNFMDENRQRTQSPQHVGRRLIGGFLAVIALGFVGYAHTVQAMQESRDREHVTEAAVNVNLSLAKDVILAARDTSTETQASVYAGALDTTDRGPADRATDQALAQLQSAIRQLHDSGLWSDARALQRTENDSRLPLERRILRLSVSGRRGEAHDLYQARYVGADRAFRLAATHLAARLEQYRQESQSAERRRTQLAVLLGWSFQRTLLAISLVIALFLSRATAAGIGRERQAQDALRHSEVRFRQLTENTSDIIRIVGPDGAGRYASPSIEACLGYPPAEMAGTSLFDGIHPDDISRVQAMFHHLLEVPDASASAEVRCRHQNGSWRYLESVGRNLLHVSGIDGIVINSRDVTERKNMENQLSHQAFHDALTALPNRSLFLDRLSHALERARRRRDVVGVIFVDLDNFKFVNDSMGHQAGDQLLVEVASRLRDCLRTGDTVARLGGDEFTLLVENIEGVASLVEVAERVQELLRQPIVVQERLLFVSASMGLAVSGNDGLASDDLLRDADVAMYQVKSKGKGSFAVFDGAMSGQALQRLEMENDMRGALDRGEFRVFFQPIVCLNTGVVKDVEALVRWEHPRDGLIPPDRFIPLAEETGLIVPIGRWVLETACRRVREQHERRPNDVPLCVSVNLSARQIQQSDLVRDVATVLAETGLPAACLKLEVTETVMVDNSSDTLARLEALRALGLQLAIDDFGMGYSSLSCLSSFPFGTLKIDRSFVSKMAEPDGMMIIEAIVSLARSLNLLVTGEGIETPEQLAQLQALNCHNGQGYHFSRPFAGEELSDFLDAAASRHDSAPALRLAA